MKLSNSTNFWIGYFSSQLLLPTEERSNPFFDEITFDDKDGVDGNILCISAVILSNKLHVGDLDNELSVSLELFWKLHLFCIQSHVVLSSLYDIIGLRKA